MAIIVRKRKKGTVYQVKVLLRSRKWITKSFKTKVEAKKYESEVFLMSEPDREKYLSSNSMILREYICLWLSKRRVFRQISDKYHQESSRYYYNHIDSVLGDVRLGELRNTHAICLLESCQKKNLGAEMQRHVFNVLYSALSDAVEHLQILDRVPIAKSLRPKQVRKVSNYLSRQESLNLLTFVGDKEYGVVVWLQLLGGLRAGEALALKWDDIDFEQKIIRVRRTLVRGSPNPKESTKNGSERIIPLCKPLCDYLLKYERRSEFITSPKSEEMLSYNTYHKALKRLCSGAGLSNVSSHSFRHSTAQIFVHHGAIKEDIQQILGHKTSSITDRYYHSARSAIHDVAGKVIVSGFESELAPNYLQKKICEDSEEGEANNE